MRRLAALAESGALPDAIETFKALLIKHLPDARTFAGNDYVQVIENQDTPENIVIIEIWQTRQHFEKYQGKGVRSLAQPVTAVLQPVQVRSWYPSGDAV